MNIAFGFRGTAAIDGGMGGGHNDRNENKWIDKSVALVKLACKHVTRAEADFLLSGTTNVRKRGNKCGIVHAGDMYASFLKAHDGDCATAMACCARRHAVYPYSVTPEFVREFLPLPVPPHNESDIALLISAQHALIIATCCNKFKASTSGHVAIADAFRQGIPMNNDAMVEAFATPEALRALVVKAIECVSEVVDEVVPSTVAIIMPGAISRARRLSRCHDGWILRAHRSAVRRFLENGNTDDATILDAVDDSRVDALKEYAVHLGVSLQPGSSQFADWLAVKHNHTLGAILLNATRFKLHVVYEADDCDFNIDEVIDKASGIGSGCMRPLWTTGRHKCENMMDILSDIEFVREVLDRRHELGTALIQKGLEYRNDSSLCETYVLEGLYTGPSWPDDAIIQRSALEQVVGIMEEMHFLFTHTRYAVFFRALRTYANYGIAQRDASRACASHDAKLAVLWEQTNGRQAETREKTMLPVRLEIVAATTPDDEMRSAYDFAIECMSEDEDERMRHSESGDTDDSDDD